MDEFWNDLHVWVSESAKGRYTDGRYADAVFESAKRFEAEVKAYAEGAMREVIPSFGRDLMNKAFSRKSRQGKEQSPILELADTTTQAGKSLQDGFALIAEGTMAAIRNEPAHRPSDSIDMDELLCRHQLYVISLLCHLLMENMVQPSPTAGWLEIVEATYGVGADVDDVTQRVQRLVQGGILTLPVYPTNLIDEDRFSGKQKTLRVRYVNADGQLCTVEKTDRQVLTLRG